jgi:hypothetical protein
MQGREIPPSKVVPPLLSLKLPAQSFLPDRECQFLGTRLYKHHLLYQCEEKDTGLWFSKKSLLKSLFSFKMIKQLEHLTQRSSP